MEAARTASRSNIERLSFGDRNHTAFRFTIECEKYGYRRENGTLDMQETFFEHANDTRLNDVWN